MPVTHSRPLFRLRQPLLAALLLGGLAATQQASAVGNTMDVQVIDRNTGQALPVYTHQGEYWVAGQPGARYAIGVRNLQGRRALAVMSVDGVNIVTGQTASTLQDGYVFDPHQYSEIAGWRKNLNELAAFHFTQPRHSYASRTGRPDDIGVIGVAVFPERRPVYPPIRPWPRATPERGEAPAGSLRGQDSAAAEASRPGTMPSLRDEARTQASPGLGTGHGERESSEVSTTRFVRASTTPAEVIRIRYDSLANLRTRGIIRPWEPPRPATPQPFPADSGFVPDPPR